MQVEFYKYVNPFERAPCYLKVYDNDFYSVWSKSKLKWENGFYNSWEYFKKNGVKNEYIHPATEIEVVVALGAQAIES